VGPGERTAWWLIARTLHKRIRVRESVRAGHRLSSLANSRRSDIEARENAKRVTGARILADRFALPAEHLFEGGYARVFRARDLRAPDERVVAVKVFRNRRPVEDRVLVETWNRELAAYQALAGHPNIVELIDWGHDDGEGNRFIVFEWVERDLLTVAMDNPFEGWDSFADTALGTLEGLAAVHRAGYIHRDIKPENVLVDSHGIAKVADFGISRAKDFFHVGMTLAPMGTPPYMPPEADQIGGAPEPTFSYDVYAFGVLVVRVLAGESLAKRSDVMARLEDPELRLDLPPEVTEYLLHVLSADPRDRPLDAQVALAQLRQIYDTRRRSGLKRREVFLDIALSAERVLVECLGIPAHEVSDYVSMDLGDAAGFYFDKADQSDSDLMIASGAFLYRCRRHYAKKGVLAVINASRLGPSILERLRRDALETPLAFRRGEPTSPGQAEETLDALYIEIADSLAERLERRERAREQESFRVWRSILEAKRQIENERGAPVRYRSFRVEGARVLFQLDADVAEEMIDEPRLVRDGQRIVLAGEVEAVTEGWARLYVTRGSAEHLRERGVLEYDSELAKSAIDRQRRALDAVRFGRALRPDLGGIVLSPASAAIPVSQRVESFLQDLDESKQNAVRMCLGAPDVAVVEGPPGTGKTTFIAELVGQFLLSRPGSRVLLTSQTHIALDHALGRLREVAQGLRMIRVGRTERMAPEIEDLRLEHQLETWREPVMASGRAFLQDYARSLGIVVPEVDVVGLANQLDRHRVALRERRSIIGVRQAERRQISEEIAQLNRLAPDVLAAASALDSVSRASSAEALREAANAFVERGLDLAARLEGANELTERLVELEQSMRVAQEELRDLSAEESAARTELAAALGLPLEAGSDEVIEAARAGGPSGDPRFEKLRALHADWELRFGRHPAFNGALLASADVVAATCVGLAGVPGAAEVPFDLCIIDEASKATATEVLVPMARSRRWVLVGDRNQLPPFQEDALDDAALMQRYDLSSAQIEQTLFDVFAERLPDEAKTLLDFQYRMVPAIGNLISHCFYDGRLRSVEREPSKATTLALDSPVLWLDTSGLSSRAERSVGTSFVNICEARIVRQVLDRLNFTAEAAGEHLRVAVLAGYLAQVDEVKRTIGAHRGEWASLEVEVSTVDAFQGREADVEIFTLTRSNDDDILGFLRRRQRINVALSRGRDGLVIVGDAGFIRRNPSDRNPLGDVLRYVERHNDCTIQPAEAS
jgi:serine/threonine protein kinase